jgi:hypothetical protein
VVADSVVVHAASATNASAIAAPTTFFTVFLRASCGGEVGTARYRRVRAHRGLYGRYRRDRARDVAISRAARAFAGTILLTVSGSFSPFLYFQCL